MLTTGSFRVRTGYLTAFLLLLVSYFLIFLTLQEFLRQIAWVEHTDLVINNLETLLSKTNEAESSSRGYVIMNDPDHLASLNAATKKVDSLLKNIDSLTADDIDRQKQADTLKAMVQEKLSFIYQGVLLFKQGGYVITDTMKGRGSKGKSLMNNIKITAQKMERDERSLLQQRKEKLKSVSISIKIITITSLIIAILLSTYSFVTFNKEYRDKTKADQQARSYWSQLEGKVKELQDANMELQELRSLEKFTATGRIARTIAHEIRNPLTNIALATDQVKSAIEPNEETTMLIDMINRNATRINQMISELLTSTKFGVLQYEETDLNALLDETLEQATDRMELKQIQLVKNYEARCKVLVDVQKMKIAFLNIIVNAIEAMETGKGVLTIRTTHVKDKCMVAISDNGVGMNEEALQKLFEPYFTNKAKGAGLGLTNTQNIILNHKGSIQVKSVLGEGSTFIITLNIAS